MGTHSMPEHDYFAWLGNSASVVTILGSIFGLLPPLAALVAIIWYMIQVYESKTYREWRARRLHDKKTRKIARLQAQQKVIQAELEALDTKRAAAAYAEHMVRNAEHVAAEKVHVAKVEAAALVEQTTKNEAKSRRQP